MRFELLTAMLVLFFILASTAALGQDATSGHADIQARDIIAAARALEEKGEISDAIEMLQPLAIQGHRRASSDFHRMTEYILGPVVSYASFFEEDTIHLKIESSVDAPTLIMQYGVGCPHCIEFLSNNFAIIRKAVSEGHLNLALLSMPRATALLDHGDRALTAYKAGVDIESTLNCVFAERGEAAFMQTFDELINMINRDIDNRIKYPGSSKELSNRYFLFAEAGNFRKDSEIKSVAEVSSFLMKLNGLVEGDCEDPNDWLARQVELTNSYDFKFGRKVGAPVFTLNGRTFRGGDSYEMISSYIEYLAFAHAGKRLEQKKR